MNKSDKELDMMLKIKPAGKIRLFSFAILAAQMSTVAAEKTNPVDYINPVIGNSAQKRCGRTIPGPHIPFGLVQLSPDTITGKGKTSGYNES